MVDSAWGDGMVDRYRHSDNSMAYWLDRLAEADKRERDKNARITTLEAEVSRLTALVEEAAGVVGPFADTADHDIGDDEADEDIFHPMTNHNSAMKITVGHMRAARAFAEKAGA